MNNEKLTPYMNKLNKDIKQDIYKLVEEYLEKKNRIKEITLYKGDFFMYYIAELINVH